jgi:hypothetical protein
LLTAESEVTKGETMTIRGVPVITLKNEGDVLYVAAAGKPYPLQMGSGSNDDHLDFLDYDVPFTVEVPPNVIDLDREVPA